MFKLLIILLLSALFGLQYQLWLAPDGLPYLEELRQAAQHAEAEHAALAARNAQLAAEIQQLKHGLDAVETYARRDLHWQRAGEQWIAYPPTTPSFAPPVSATSQ